MKNGLIIDNAGNSCWYLNDKLHREDGPAVADAFGNCYWYLNGEYHRLDGPAIVYLDGVTFWALNDKVYDTLNEWLEKHPTMTKDEKILFKLSWIEK
jgi:hypothetical protein